MYNWKYLISFNTFISKKSKTSLNYNWKKEAINSVCEIYYIITRIRKNYNSRVVNLRMNSDFNIFLFLYMFPLEKYKVWKALFPNKISSLTAYSIDEAVKLLIDFKLIDMIAEGNVINVSKIINIIKDIRIKYIKKDR